MRIISSKTPPQHLRSPARLIMARPSTSPETVRRIDALNRIIAGYDRLSPESNEEQRHEGCGRLRECSAAEIEWWIEKENLSWRQLRTASTNGMTPLFVAAGCGRNDIFDILARRGAASYTGCWLPDEQRLCSVLEALERGFKQGKPHLGLEPADVYSQEWLTPPQVQTCLDRFAGVSSGACHLCAGEVAKWVRNLPVGHIAAIRYARRPSIAQSTCCTPPSSFHTVCKNLLKNFAKVF